MKKVFVYFLATALVSSLTAFAVVKLTDKERGDYNENSATLPLRNVTLSDQLYPDFTFAAETAVKAVVHVKVTKKGMEQPFTIYDFFFGYGNPGMSPRNQVNSGSGVIITSDGYIITNFHVVANADKLTVIDREGKEYAAKLIRKNESLDLALLKIEKANFKKTYVIPSAKNYTIGDDIFVIGTPTSVELGQTISKGIISGNRTFDQNNFIQTDASVNGGNSGGALTKKSGELIGIVNAKISGLGVEGLGFSIPAELIITGLSITN